VSSKPLFKYGILQNVFLTPRQYEELLTKLGRVKAEKYIDELSTYIPNRTKRPYKNHFAVILQWWLKDRRDDDGLEAAVDDKEPYVRPTTR